MSRLLGVFVCAAAAAFALPQDQRPQNRHAVLTRLANDISTGIGRAGKLSEKDRKKLDDSRTVFLQMADVKGRLGATDHKDLKKSIDEVKKRTKKFADDDRRAIEADLRDADRLGLDKEPRTPRPRPLRRPNPYPRRWP